MNHQEPTNVYRYQPTGVSKTTEYFFRDLPDGKLEVRCGIALMGCTNMTKEQLKTANPFSEAFRDNYAAGIGTNKDTALANLDEDIYNIAATLF